MKIKILILAISVLLMLAACSGPADDTAAAPPETAMISMDETKKEIIKETTAEITAPPKQEETKLPSGMKAQITGPATEKTEPSGEEYWEIYETMVTENDHSKKPQADPQPAWDTASKQDMAEPSKPAESVPPSAAQETSCRHSEVYVSGFIQATCISEGYSGDEICAVCGALIRQGYTTGTADHQWTAKTVHEDAYLTCYCGQIFFSADDHDRHVNEMLSAGDPPDRHGCIWTAGTDRTVYTCSVCGSQLNN